MTGSSRVIDINKVDSGERHAREDHVAVEEPLEIQLSSITAGAAAARSISITMRTPGHDVELALGFLFTEAIISSIDEVSDTNHTGTVDPESGLRNIIRIELKPNVEIDFAKLQRHFYTTSSCGVCGKASIDALRVAGQKSLENKGATYSHGLVTALPDKLRQQQRVFSQTGGLHAAAMFDEKGDLVVVREDVGRHNAVDKVIGALLLKGEVPASEKGLLVSGRASFELVQKALVAGITTLIAVSAPSSLAISLAREYGMTLIGFLRGETFNIYAGADRITERQTGRP
jgi:FdhD protein